MSVNDKRTLYVGGLEESEAEATVRAAFIPFGEITEVNLPLDNSSTKHKGFAFVQYEDKDDAAHAIDNMNNAELNGRVLRVNLAKPDAVKGGHRPVWESKADDFFKNDVAAREWKPKIELTDAQGSDRQLSFPDRLSFV